MPRKVPNRGNSIPCSTWTPCSSSKYVPSASRFEVCSTSSVSSCLPYAFAKYSVASLSPWYAHRIPSFSQRRDRLRYLILVLCTFCHFLLLSSFPSPLPSASAPPPAPKSPRGRVLPYPRPYPFRTPGVFTQPRSPHRPKVPAVCPLLFLIYLCLKLKPMLYPIYLLGLGLGFILTLTLTLFPAK